MTEPRYLAVLVAERELIASLEPVYGVVLTDGRMVAKVWTTDVPEAVEDLGSDLDAVRAAIASRLPDQGAP